MINKVRYHVYKILPLAYDDSLSYYEVLAKLTESVNEVIDRINYFVDLSDELDALSNKVDTNYNDLNQKIVTINLQIADLNKIRSDITENTRRITALEGVAKGLDGLFADVNTRMTIMHDELAAQMNADKRQLQEEMLNYYGQLFDTVRQLQVEITKAFVDIYNYSANARLTPDKNNAKLYVDLENAISAEEYCSLGLTADEYKTYGIDALSYIRDSKKLLHYDWPYMPVEGVKQSPSICLDEAVNELWNTLTAEEYKALDIDADAYATLNFTNTAYRKYNPNKTTGGVTISPNNGGLTTEQYSNLGIEV